MPVGGAVGHPIPRGDGPAKVAGQALSSADGQPVAVVVGETSAAAAQLVGVTYDAVPSHVDFAVEQGRAKPAKGARARPASCRRSGKDQRWSKAAGGAQFGEVRVDVDTGELRISRWLGMFDVGRVINPTTAASQLRGSIVMGLDMAMSEQTLVDPRNGRTVSAGLDAHHVPVQADVPHIDVDWLDVPDRSATLGIVGLGEVGVTGVTAALSTTVVTLARVGLAGSRRTHAVAPPACSGPPDEAVELRLRPRPSCAGTRSRAR